MRLTLEEKCDIRVEEDFRKHCKENNLKECSGNALVEFIKNRRKEAKEQCNTSN